jgi:ADP-heptose:LPS heptosyltransferase
MVFFAYCGIKSGGGWTVTRTNILSKYQSLHIVFQSEQHRLRNVLATLDISQSGKAFEWYTQQDVLFVKNLLHNKPLLVLAPGAKLAKKQWPIERFQELAQWYKSQNYQVAVIGDSSDAQLIEKWLDDETINMCGKLTVAQSAALLSLAALCISNDSGPMHLAYSVRTPVLALFSARNYKGKWYPPAQSKHSVLVTSDIHCRGCMNKPCADNICMKKISLEKVKITAGQLLNS